MKEVIGKIPITHKLKHKDYGLTDSLHHSSQFQAYFSYILKNGKYIRNDIAIFIKTNTIARQSPPVAKYAPIGAGNVHGGIICVGVTIPSQLQNMQLLPLSGVMINGIIKIGFSTIGNPNMTGSFILKIPGTIQVLDNAFEYFDRPNTIIANTSPNVAPEPPIHINH